MSGASDLVVDHLGDLVWLRLPRSFHRGGVFRPSVDEVSLLYFLLVGSVLLVEAFLGGRLKLSVPFPGLFVVRGLGSVGYPGQLGVDLPVEHQVIGHLSSHGVVGAAVRRHILLHLLFQIMSSGVCGMNHQFEVPVEPLHHPVCRWVYWGGLFGLASPFPNFNSVSVVDLRMWTTGYRE